MQLHSDDGKELSVSHRLLGQRVLAELKRHYPAVAAGWDVSINQRGILFIRNILLAGRMGCCLHTQQIDPELKSVMRAGGELLERYRIARARALSERAALELISEQPRNLRGDLVAEV